MNVKRPIRTNKVSYPKLSCILLGLGLMISGCAPNLGNTATALRTNLDDMATSQAFEKMVTGPWPAANWWTAFADPQLNQLMMEALTDAPTLHAAEARVRRALAIAGVTAAARSPQATFHGSSTYQRFTQEGAVPPDLAGKKRSVNLLSLDMVFNLDLWGKNRSAYEAVLGEMRVMEIESAAAQLELTTAIATTYVRLNHAFAQSDIAAAILKQQEKVAELTARRVAAGIDSAVELNHTQGVAASTKTSIRALEEQISLLRNQLAVLVGAAPARGDSIVAPTLLSHHTVTLPSQLPAELIGRRPDILAQRWRIKAMNSRIAEAKAEFYPNINLISFAGFDSIGIENIITSGSRVFGIGPAISLPLFDGGRLRRNLEGRLAAYDENVEIYNALILDAIREVADQVASWQGVEAQQLEEQKAVTRFAEANRLALLRYRQGLSNYLTVLKTEEALLQEKRREATLNARQLEIMVALAKALGGGYLANGRIAGTVPVESL